MSQNKTSSSATMIDAHSHLADPRIADIVDDMIMRSRQRGIEKFIQAGVGPEDWQKQDELAQRYPDVVIPCYGLHPYWVAAHTDQECEAALTELERRLPSSPALGECGLDFRRLIANGREQSQIRFFLEQLDMTRSHRLSAIFHFVRCHDTSVKALKAAGPLARESVVHAFTGAPEIARSYLDLGLLLSVGGPVLRREADKLHASLKLIPLDRLLIESDSPDQPPPGLACAWNEPWTIRDVAAKIGEIKNIETERVIEICRANTKRVFAL